MSFGYRVSVLVLLCCFMVSLAACGGGGGSTPNASAPTVSGTASEGTLIVGKTVKLKDANGKSGVDTTTNSTTGTYSIDVTGLTAPYLVTVTGTNGTYVSLAQAAGTANINPITTTVVALAAGTSDVSALFTNLTPAQLTTINTNYTPKSALVSASLQTALPVGVKVEDYFTGTIAAATSMDAIFDTYQITVHPTDGITVKTKDASAATLLTIPVATVTANTNQPLPTMTIKLLAPTGVVATSSASKNTISWQPVTGATNYNLYWSTSPSVTNITGNKVINASNPYVHSSTTDATTYYYILTALKDGVESDASSVQSITSSKVVDIAANSSNAIVLKSDGSVWTWSPSSIPAKVPGLTSIRQIACGNTFFVALKSDGTLWAWGDNSYGQLGDGTTASRKLPVQINIADVKSITGGQNSTFALKHDGTVWAWGWNGQFGQLGYGSTSTNDFKTSPVQIQGLTSVSSIYAYANTSFAIKSDGTLWGWGANYFGQIGDGTLIDRIAPVLVPGISNIKSISLGSSRTYAVINDGTMLMWGGGGTLQGNSAISSLSPVPLAGVSGVSTCSTATGFLTVVKLDGTVWTDVFDLDLTVWNNKFIQVQGFDNAIYNVSGSGFNLILNSDGLLSWWDISSGGVNLSNSSIKPKIIDAI